MPARDVAPAVTIAEPPDDARGAAVQSGSVRLVAGESLLDVPPNEFRERQAAIAGPRPESPCLLICQLDLGSDHGISVSTS